MRRAKPPFKIMLTDASTLDWVCVGPEKAGKVKEFFKEFHGKPLSNRWIMFICHPETTWDGAGGYTVPAGQWAPVMVARKGGPL